MSQPVRIATSTRRDHDAIGEPIRLPGRNTARVPTYRLHRPSGQAVVTLVGRDRYLGKFGSIESRRAYERLIAEWVAAGCPKTIDRGHAANLTIKELILRYWQFVRTYYNPRTRAGTIAPALRRLRRLYGTARVGEFGPKSLKAFRQSLIDERDDRGRRLSRTYINRATQWVRRLFRWGVSEELVPVEILQALQAVEGLKAGRTTAPENEPVKAVSDAVIELTLPHLSPVVRDMVRIQRLTGMRPGEVCAMTTGELDTTSTVWTYTPRHHKTSHHGKSRAVLIGPRAQVILGRYLKPELLGYVFGPAESVRATKDRLRVGNQTPFTPSRRHRDAMRAANPKRTLNGCYSTTNYAQAIRRACIVAGIAHWAPNQLRHARATEIRRTHGLDAAGAVLGHSKLETTQIYAERSMELAAAVALKTG